MSYTGRSGKEVDELYEWALMAKTVPNGVIGEDSTNGANCANALKIALRAYTCESFSTHQHLQEA